MKSNFVTLSYLKNVRSKNLYVPMYRDVRLLPCPKPPEKREIANELMKATKLINKDIGIKFEGALPDTWWMLAVLSTVDSEHRYFKKDYCPSVKKKVA